MTVQSVISIDVDDSHFARFNELFQKYQSQLAKSPAIWAKVGKENAAVSRQFEAMTASLMAQNSLARELSEMDRKRLDHLKNSERLWTSMSKSSVTVAKSVTSATISILKWGSILGAGLLGGGLFGIDRMAASVSDSRRSAMGLGMSIGAQKSFGVNLGRFVDPNSFLEGVSNAQQIGHQGVLYGLGVNPNADTQTVSLETLKAVRNLVKNTDEKQLGVLGSSRNLDQINLTLDDLRRIKGTSDSEWNAQLGKQQRGVGDFGLDPATALKWTNLNNQLTAAGEAIFKTFVVGLTPLAPSIEKLSAALVKVLTTALEKDGPIERGVKNIAEWIDGFSGKISGSGFLESVDKFVGNVGALSDAIDWIVHPIDNASKTGWASYLGGKMTDVSNFFGGGDTKRYNSYLGMLDSLNHLPPGMLERIKQTESGDSMNPANSSKGAIGTFQFMPDTAKQYGIDPTDPMQSARGAARYMADHLTKYQGNIAKALAAYNWGEGNVEKASAAHPKNWLSYAPAETQKYVTKNTGMTLTIINQTGGNAVPVLNAMNP